MKITGQTYLRDEQSVRDIESSSLAGYCRIYGPICARAANRQIRP